MSASWSELSAIWAIWSEQKACPAETLPYEVRRWSRETPLFCRQGVSLFLYGEGCRSVLKSFFIGKVKI